jgi:hypothetical protein
VALVITGVSEEHIAFHIRLKRINKLKTMLAITSNRNPLRVALVRTDVWEEYIVSMIGAERISKIGTILAVTTN